jgi:hypothetical protein
MKKQTASGADGQMKNAYKILVRIPEGRNHLKEIAVDGRLMLTRLLSKWSVCGCELDTFSSGYEQWCAVKDVQLP